MQFLDDVYIRGKINGLNANQFLYLDKVDDNVQDQLDSKAFHVETAHKFSIEKSTVDEESNKITIKLKNRDDGIIDTKEFIYENYKVTNIPNNSQKIYLTGTSSATQTTDRQYYNTNVFISESNSELNVVTNIKAGSFEGDGKNITNLSGAYITTGPINSTLLKDLTTITAGSYGQASNENFTVGSQSFNIPYITIDQKGLVTAISTKTVQLPPSTRHDIYTINGDGSTKSFDIIHNKDSYGVIVELYDTTYTTIYATVKRLNSNKINVTFEDAPSNGELIYVTIL